MPLTDPYMKRVDLNQITLDNVAKIKVIKGPSSVLYGPNTAGGIVNIITERGEDLETYIDQRFGDYKNFRTVAKNKGTIGPFNHILGGSYEHSNGFAISDDFEGALNQQDRLRVNSDFERYNLAGRVGYDITERGSVSVGGGY